MKALFSNDRATYTEATALQKVKDLIIQNSATKKISKEWDAIFTAEVKKIVANAKYSTSKLVVYMGQCISQTAHIAWTTVGHVGTDVNLYCAGPSVFTRRCNGNHDNTHLNHIMTNYLNLDLQPITLKLRGYKPNGNQTAAPASTPIVSSSTPSTTSTPESTPVITSTTLATTSATPVTTSATPLAIPSSSYPTTSPGVSKPSTTVWAKPTLKPGCINVSVALSASELLGTRQRKGFMKLFRKYCSSKKSPIDWYYLNSLYGVDVPLVLMNSFNTHEETVRIIRKYRMHNLSIHTFNQVRTIYIGQQQILTTKCIRAATRKGVHFYLQRRQLGGDGMNVIYDSLYICTNSDDSCCLYSLLMNPDRGVTTIPIVKLGREFQTAQQYSERFEKGIPNILELDHLTVAGDVKFGSGITLKGTVILVANEGAKIELPDGTILEDKVVTGDLRILDH
ncbi:hypothetical protein DYB35_000065 [Aphanomyces astaci]|uniref:UTP--glucose-1-phosphate uridylyltransferase n=1 Tax=Aphanomyces astaci TaxID=112090 RepID=A0A3R7BU91_APHAT|nr:hypothetical protein DYB35_000065 [Aphanomyces astaci]